MSVCAQHALSTFFRGDTVFQLLDGVRIVLSVDFHFKFSYA
jgi:hypothetical protein